jgi:membrane protein CcdC involved in cytochrome C biogenesis
LRLWVRLVREVFMATQFLALVLVFFAVGTAAYVELVNIGVIYSW